MPGRVFALLLAVIVFAGPAVIAVGPDTDWTALRRAALNRPRRLIFNNDGNEPVYLCKAATAEELLRSRTAPLIGSKVSSIFYCTWSSGFGVFTHHTKAGQLFDTQEGLFKENRTREFFEKGIDPLKVIADFGRKHGIEVFWSMRMNDTHDASLRDYGPIMFRANRLKMAHPAWLIGSKEKPPKYGTWSSVDYGVPEIRDLAFRYCEEVVRGYDVDGIELDFFRHAFFFKCSGENKPCGAKELGQMSDLVRRIRAAAEDAAKKRGKPILLAVRVPDSIEYCRFIGLDLQQWLEDGLLDILAVSGYTQLNPWDYSVRLRHKYGVKVYPSLDEPRLRDQEANSLRRSLPAYRGRALAGWNAGVDGIYLFNYFDPASSLWRELDDPSVMREGERSYFPSIRGAGSAPVPHQGYLNVPTLNPSRTLSASVGKPASVSFQTGEIPGKRPAKTVLRLRVKPDDALKNARVLLNKTALEAAGATGSYAEFKAATGALQPGKNVIDLEVVSGGPITLLDCYVAASP